MAEMISFPSNGRDASGYLAIPASGSGPGVIVIQEWWGLNSQIKGVCERFAEAGFTALAVDFYAGVVTTEPDEAGKLMMSLNIDQAANDMAAAITVLCGLAAVSSTGIGVIGYCMGGALALHLSARNPKFVRAVAPYYGVVGWPQAEVDWNAINAKIQGHYAEHDDFASPAAVAGFAEQLRAAGKDFQVFTYSGTQHAFANEMRPEVFNSAATELSWSRTIEFFRKNIE